MVRLEDENIEEVFGDLLVQRSQEIGLVKYGRLRMPGTGVECIFGVFSLNKTMQVFLQDVLGAQATAER